MAKSSINFKPVKATSERHNERKQELDYVHSDLTANNESWKADSIQERRQEAESLCKEKTGRRMQAKATPIREAVVNLNADHTMADLKELAAELKKQKGIDCFQIHIHRDEGKSREELNHHAHMVFGWQDKKTGKSIKLNRRDMSEVQTIVAEKLGMERGELKENSNRERLEAIEFKKQERQKEVEQLQAQCEALEQKKNADSERYRVELQHAQDRAREQESRHRAEHERVAREIASTKAQISRFNERTRLLATETMGKGKERLKPNEKELKTAIRFCSWKDEQLLQEIEARRSENARLRREIEQGEREETELKIKHYELRGWEAESRKLENEIAGLEARRKAEKS